jgi:protein transport protein SEC24
MSQAEHQRRKRMYPQQITQAYLDQPSPAQSYDQQYQATQNPAASSAQYFVPGSQQQPGQQGAPGSPSAQGYGQQPQQQPGAPLPGQQQPYQAPVANMTNQFSNMSFGGGAQVKLDLCLIG